MITSVIDWLMYWWGERTIEPNLEVGDLIQDIILELLLTHPFYGYVASQLTVVESDTLMKLK